MFLETLWRVLSYRGQVQFFVYLWLFMTVYLFLRNQIDLRRVKNAALYTAVSYALMVIVMLNWNTYANYRTETMYGFAVIAFLAFTATMAGFVTAYLLNRLSYMRQGWLYRRASQWTAAMADWVEGNVRPADILRKFASKMDDHVKKIEYEHPLNVIIQNLESEQS